MITRLHDYPLLALQIQKLPSTDLQTKEHFEGPVVPWCKTCECCPQNKMPAACLGLRYKRQTACSWFLFDPQVKLSGVDLSGVTEGVPSTVLNLIWSIILHFQASPRRRWGAFNVKPSHCLPTSNTGETGGAKSERAIVSEPLVVKDITPAGGQQWRLQQQLRRRSCVKKSQKGRCGVKASWPNNQDSVAAGANADVKVSPTLKTKQSNEWWRRNCNRLCSARFGVQVRDFGKSWSSGMAIVALIRSINPALVDLRESWSSDPRQNLQLAFNIADRCLDIPPLLESEGTWTQFWHTAKMSMN